MEICAAQLTANAAKPVVNYLLDFSDVAGEAWYTEAVRWATSQGIVGGYGYGTFGPNAPITREQLAVLRQSRRHPHKNSCGRMWTFWLPCRG